MRVVLISDTHNRGPEVQIPDGDVLIHAGDFTGLGRVPEICDAGAWFCSLPHKHKVFVAGNHDYLFERDQFAALKAFGLPRVDKNVHYLENNEVTIENKLRIWGSPVQPTFCNWAFNVDRGRPIRKVWDQIPSGLDLLITHGPPRGIGDQAAPHLNTEHFGCDDLLEAVKEKKPAIHVFGHIHGGYGVTRTAHTDFYNASMCDESYKIANKPWVVDL
jgi:Icc-related predicted phosphoesterase